MAQAPSTYAPPSAAGDGWPVARAAAVQLAEQRLSEMDGVIRNGDFGRITSVLIARNGRLVYESYFSGSADDLRNTRSVTKTVTGMLVGVAVADGPLEEHTNDNAPCRHPTYDEEFIMRQEPPGSGPKYDGNCAFAVRLGKVGIPAQHEAVIDGTVYRFKNVVAKWLFNVLPNSAQKADANWAEAQDRRRTGSRADPSREGGPGV